MAAVDPTTVYLFAAGILVLIIIIVSFINKSGDGKDKGNNEGRQGRQAPVARQAAAGPAGMRRRAPRGNRMRLNQQDDSDEDDGGDSRFDDIPQTEGKIGAKKLKKLQEKAEKKAMREQEERDREERKKKDKEYEEQRKAREEMEKKEEEMKEEEERKRKEEQERIEHEEYLKMKDMFSVDEEGEGELDADLNSESLLEQFINYIKETKVVMLEDLAGHFKLKTQDVIARVQDLQAGGRLTGVVDDRGKFIYITRDELEAVARYIRQNGRVSISDLAASSNRLINLEPETSSVALKMAAEATDLSEQSQPIAAAD